MAHNKILLAGIVGVGGFFVFLAYSFLSFTSASGNVVRLNSPDETANYFFARTYAASGAIGYTEQLLEASKGVVHPRSMTTAGDRVVPVGFLGLAVLYGVIAKLVGSAGILFLTPFLAVLSAFLFYLFLSHIFARRVAALSAVLLLIHPAYWYYASRGMLPNVLFIDLLLAGALFLVMAYKKNHALFYLLGGFFVGLSLTVRLSEIIWVFSAIALAAVCMLGRRLVIATPLFVLGCALPLAGLFLMNTSVYGHPFIFGYQSAATYESAASFDRVIALISSSDWQKIGELKSELGGMFAQLRAYAFPFGFDPPTFTKHFQQYGVGMFWWFTLPAIFGVLLTLRRGLYEFFLERKRGLLLFLLISGGVGYWLVAFYGSWVFFDNISEEVTIGNSYVRYWLPLYLLSIPFVATTFVSFLRGGRGRLSRTLIACATVIVMMFFSGKAVLYEYRDSIFPVAENIRSYHRSAAWIVQMTEPDAVIFSERSDKNFFPERKVAQSFPNLAERDLVPPLFDRVPVYYYSMWTPEDAAYVSRRYFAEYELKLEPVALFERGERLYRVVKIQNEEL
jgi:hypothetical protein